MTTEVVPQADNRRLVLELAGAAAGVVVFVSLVGAAVISARLHSLGLPIDSTLSVLPRETVVIAGVRALSGGLLVALVVLSLLWVLDRLGVSLGRDEASRWPTPWEAGVLVLAVVPLLAFTLDYGVTTSMVILSFSAAGVAAGVVLLILRRSESFGQQSVRFLVVVAALGGVLAFARVYNQPIALDFATVQLKDGGRTNGFLLGQSSGAIVLAPDVLRQTIGRTVAIPRDEVVNLQLSRVTPKVSPIGPNPAPRVDVKVPGPNASMRQRDHFLQQRLLNIRLSGQWKYPPLIYTESVNAWEKSFDQFSQGGKVPAGERPQRASLEDLNEFTPLFAGQMVITKGRVLEATPREDKKPQTIVLRDRRYLATCDIWPPGLPLKPRQVIHLRGLVIASGIFVSGAGVERNRVAMACSSAQPWHARHRPTQRSGGRRSSSGGGSRCSILRQRRHGLSACPSIHEHVKLAPAPKKRSPRYGDRRQRLSLVVPSSIEPAGCPEFCIHQERTSLPIRLERRGRVCPAAWRLAGAISRRLLAR